MSNIVSPTKFVLKFDLSAYRPSVVCKSTGFHSELYGDYKFSNVAAVKDLLVKHFIAREEEDTTNTNTFWVYNVNNTNITATVYRAPRLAFWPVEGDFEAMASALTQAKVGASFFDVQIEKHLTSVGIKTTRENVRLYRKPYIAQISKMLLEEILNKPSTAYITRWFDRINGNSHFSLNLSGGRFSINVPMAYGYGNAEGLVVRALRLDWPRTKSACDVLTGHGVTVVDLGYSLKRNMYRAAFHI